MSLNLGVDYTRVMFGENAVHVPAWLVVQDAGEGKVSFAGGSRGSVDALHPLRYGSQRTHQLIVGEIVVRPHTVTATDTRRGSGIDGLLLDPFTGLADEDAEVVLMRT